MIVLFCSFFVHSRVDVLVDVVFDDVLSTLML